MHVYLETERLILRRFTDADVDHIVELDSDPEVMRFITGGSPTPREAIEHDYLPVWLAYYEHGDRYGFWAAIEQSTGDFLGWFHFRPMAGTDPNVPELGYRLRRSAWGKGYATEGAQALIDNGFSHLGVASVTAMTYEHNLGSRRVMEKVGMTLVRTFRLTAEDLQPGGDFHDAGIVLFDGDDVEYAIDRAAWERQRQHATTEG